MEVVVACILRGCSGDLLSGPLRGEMGLGVGHTNSQAVGALSCGNSLASFFKGPISGPAVVQVVW